MSAKILDEISQNCGCYISDLKYQPLSRLAAVLKSMGLKNYSIEELNYGLSYILNKKCSFSSPEELIDFLQQTEGCPSH
ncbi:MAG TPA: hypothetical protein IAA58_06475 [Candidatus Gallacutalibacter stercoravium]|nr:hypothetical protein [Candidatus Gallacutalibacter stercoravium]